MDDPPLPPDPSLTPLLLFDSGRGGVELEDATDDARLVYSIPKRQLLLARGLAGFIDDVNWITPRGWVLTLNPASRDVSLRDPFTSRIVRLPPDPDRLLTTSEDTKCVMSTHPPTDPGCVVLMIHRRDPVLCYCRPGESQWFRHEYQPELLVDGDLDPDDRDSIIEEVGKLVPMGDRFHTYLDWLGKMVTLEISRNPTLSSSHAVDNPPMPPVCHSKKHCLVESCEELFMVRFYYSLLCRVRTLRLHVHKLDWRRNAWAKVTRLGIDRAFFISIDQYSHNYLFGASVPADKSGLKANSIYFSNIDDKGLYVHDMEQATTTMLNPGPEIPDAMEPILLMPVV